LLAAADTIETYERVREVAVANATDAEKWRKLMAMMRE
jgi:hypothetical protein